MLTAAVAVAMESAVLVDGVTLMCGLDAVGGDAVSEAPTVASRDDFMIGALAVINVLVVIGVFMSYLSQYVRLKGVFVTIFFCSYCCTSSRQCIVCRSFGTKL